MRNSPFRALLLVAVVAGVLSAASLAHPRAANANGVTVAVLGLEGMDGTPDQVAAAITDAIRQRVSSSPGLRLVQGRDLVEVKLVFSCPDEGPLCMTDAAKSMGAAKLIFGSARKAGADTFLVTLKLLDAERSVIESWTTDQLNRSQSSGAALRAPVQKWVATLTGQAIPGTVRVQGGVVGASVALDGVTAGVMGQDGLIIAGVAPGKHELLVTKSGYEPVRKSFSLDSGGNESVAVEMSATGTALPPAEPAAEPGPLVTSEIAETSAPAGSRLGLRATAWALAGAGVIAAAIGVRFGLQVIDINDKLDPYRRYPCPGRPGQTCNGAGVPAPPISDPKLQDWIDENREKGQSFETWQYVCYGAAGALLGTSVYFFYRGYAAEPAVATAHGRGPRLRFAPVLGPGTVAASASLRF